MTRNLRAISRFFGTSDRIITESTVNLLSVGAVLGKDFDLFTALKLAGQSPPKLSPIRQAQQRHIVWAKAADERCAFIHDKLRQTFLNRLPDDKLKECHLQAARHLESEFPDQVYELAYHFDAAQ